MEACNLLCSNLEDHGRTWTKIEKTIVTLYPKNNSKVCLNDHTTLSFINGYINILLLL